MLREKPRENIVNTRKLKAVIYFVFKSRDENQKKKQINMHGCTWAFSATVHKEKI